MRRMERAELLHRYAAGADEVRAAVAGLRDVDLDRRPVGESGGWSARQIVHHLADSEMTSAIRLRRLIAEEAPVIDGYDENEFARRLHYDRRPIGPSLDALTAARAASLQLLEVLSDEEWRRKGTHGEIGPYSIEDWLLTYVAHPYDHAEQIRRAMGAGTATSRQVSNTSR